MKTTPLPVLIPGLLLFGSSISSTLGEDFRSAHHVEPGDIISAEMVNELFDNIQETQRTITMRDLLGTWKGTSYAVRYYGVAGWETIIPNRCYSLTNTTVNFVEVSNNYYEVQTSAPDSFVANSSGGRIERVDVAEGVLFGINDPCTPYTIDRISKNRIRLTSDDINLNRAKLITLDRQNVPPDKPKILSATAFGSEVCLTWQDNSDNEDAFVILRRDGISGSYTNVSAVPGNSASCTNTVPHAGFYWFRVVASNACGLSLGSNVKRVVVTE